MAVRSILLSLLLLSIGCSGSRLGEQPPAESKGDSNASKSASFAASGTESTSNFDNEFTLPWSVADGPNGTYYMSSQVSSGMAVVVDTLLMSVRRLGSKGEGPGEYHRGGRVFRKADSVFVMDHERGSVNVFRHDGKFLRMTRGTVIVTGSALLLRGDTIVFSQNIRSPDAFGRPVHLLSPNDGSIVRSFGSDDRSVEPGFSVPQTRILAAESDSSFWVARRDMYVIELWTLSGRMLRRLTMSREWFPKVTRSPTLDEPIFTTVAKLHSDHQGRLTVFLLRPHPNWKAPPPPAGGVEVAAGSKRFEGSVQGMIEVLDARSGKVISSEILPDSLSQLAEILPDGRLVFVRTDSEGSQTPFFLRAQRPPN